jgi:hypothetical protein
LGADPGLGVLDVTCEPCCREGVVVTAGLCELPIGDDGVCDAVVEVRCGGDVTAVAQADDEIGDWCGEAPDLMEHDDSNPGYGGRH